MGKVTDEVMNSELGVLGNCDEGLTIDYVKTEIVNKAEQGDVNSVFKLNQIVRHSKNAEVVAYAKAQLDRIDGVAEEVKVVATDAE